MSPSGYITAPRLVPRRQHLQGDIFEAVPFLVPTALGSAEIEKLLAILLTPTCDFAVKTGGGLRQVYAIEVLTLDSPLRQQFAKDVVPHHVCPLPLLDPLLPHGGAVHLRRVSPVHAEQLETSTRIATLNESGLRALLVGLTRYYLRTQLDSTQIPIPADDPRLLWNAIDIARGEQKVKDKRDKVNRVLEVAIEAIIRHHGLRVPSVAVGLRMLQIIAQKNAISKESCSAIYTMLDIRERLLKTYQNPPRDFNELRPVLDDFLTELEQAGIVLQERSPVQITEQQYDNLSRLGD